MANKDERPAAFRSSHQGDDARLAKEWSGHRQHQKRGLAEIRERNLRAMGGKR